MASQLQPFREVRAEDLRPGDHVIMAGVYNPIRRAVQRGPSEHSESPIRDDLTVVECHGRYDGARRWFPVGSRVLVFSPIPYRSGTLAYVDGFRGLVPCKVLRVGLDRDGCVTVTVRVTAQRPGYRRGETLTERPDDVVPRDCVRRTRYGARIRNWYQWQES